MVKAPVGINFPLVPLCINGKHIGFKGFIGGQIEMFPCSLFVGDNKTERLYLPVTDVDGDCSEGCFVTGLEGAFTDANRVPDSGRPCRQLTVSNHRPVVCGQNDG